MNNDNNQNIYGIIASMLGVDALTAADQDLILSSASPLLKIFRVVKVTVSIPASTLNVPIFTHNLGYAPFYLIWESNSGLWMSGGSMYSSCTSTTIRYSNYGGSAMTNKTFIIMVCRNPLIKNVLSPIFRTQSREAAIRNRDYGLITAKDGKSTDSEDMRDFTFHSDTRALLIHRVLAGSMVNTGSDIRLEWTNDLPYIPIWFAFTSIDMGVSWQYQYGGGQAPPIAIQDTGTGNVSTRGFDPGDGTLPLGSIWIFKDPFTLPATEVVQVS